ncbi:hypothetical protein MXD63_30005 [Frankia sp. Cpl3]|nr:hypothetical protein [Frankia sp. Cpl3]
MSVFLTLRILLISKGKSNVAAALLAESTASKVGFWIATEALPIVAAMIVITTFTAYGFRVIFFKKTHMLLPLSFAVAIMPVTGVGVTALYVVLYFSRKAGHAFRGWRTRRHSESPDSADKLGMEEASARIVKINAEVRKLRFTEDPDSTADEIDGLLKERASLREHLANLAPTPINSPDKGRELAFRRSDGTLNPYLKSQLLLIVGVASYTLFSGTTPWLPRETIKLTGETTTGYVISSTPAWTTILVDDPRDIKYVKTSVVLERTACDTHAPWWTISIMRIRSGEGARCK